MNKILLGLGIVVLGIVGFLYPKIQPTDYSKITQLEQQVGDLSLKVSQNTDAFGAISIPSAPYLFQTTLSAAISSTENSMALVNGTLKDGTSLTGYQCFTVDTGTALAEYICGTASGTAITGLLRGINPLNPAATSTALAFAHRRGADVRISDFPILQVLKRLNDGTDSFPSRISLDSTIATSTFTTYNLVNKQYVDGVALQGSPTATTTTAGVVQIGTTAQIVAGTGMTGAYTLVPAGSLFSQAWRSATTVPVTNATGTLSSLFIDQKASYTWSGIHIFNATTTLATTTVNGKDVFNNLGKFGGTGVDGALTITSGTTTIDCTLAIVCVKNYTSISITGTGVLAFSNPTSTGTTIILKSQGAVILTSSATPMINAKGMGAAGGAGISTSDSAVHTGISGAGGNTLLYQTQGGVASDGDVGLGTGGGVAISWIALANSSLKYPFVFSGGGGGGGGTTSSAGSTSISGAGGNGGGALIIECGGALNFTTTGGISVAGTNGGSGSFTGTNYKAAGGGGGGGGYALILYNNLTANSGTITVSGGTGGSSAMSSGTLKGSGGGGSLLVGGTAGTIAGNGVIPGGGTGGTGSSLIILNTEF